MSQFQPETLTRSRRPLSRGATLIAIRDALEAPGEVHRRERGRGWSEAAKPEDFRPMLSHDDTQVLRRADEAVSDVTLIFIPSGNNAALVYAKWKGDQRSVGQECRNLPVRFPHIAAVGIPHLIGAGDLAFRINSKGTRRICARDVEFCESAVR